MPIIGYTENPQKNEVIYTVGGDHDPKNIKSYAAKDLLASRPILVELFEYRNDVTTETRVEPQLTNEIPFPKRMQNMIIDYFEVKHINVALQLIENMFGNGKRPPFSMLLAIVNSILQPKNKFKNGLQLKEHWAHCKKGHAILLDVLNLFGPETYDPLWNQFKYFERIPTREASKEHDDDYDQLDTKELGNFRDFWDLTDKLLNHGTSDIEGRCRRLILDFFVKLLQKDLKSRVVNGAMAKESIFVKTLNHGRSIKPEYYYRILFKSFPHENEDLIHLSEDILNMLITISCFESITNQKEAAHQLYMMLQQMNTDSYLQLMQTIKYPSFVIQICDLALADTDISRVEDEYRHFRNSSHTPLHLEKLFFYAFRTLPNSLESIDNIYRHVSIVCKYSMCILATATINHKAESEDTNTALSEDQLRLMIICQNEVIQEWMDMIEQLISAQDYKNDFEVIEKIRWSMRLTLLTITEYF